MSTTALTTKGERLMSQNNKKKDPQKWELSDMINITDYKTTMHILCEEIKEKK